jgi:ankyrin repeat protein
LICAGADINLQDEEGRTALMICAGSDLEFSMFMVTRLLQSEGVNPHVRDKKNRNAYDYAALRGNQEAAQTLWKAMEGKTNANHTHK